MDEGIKSSDGFLSRSLQARFCSVMAINTGKEILGY